MDYTLALPHKARRSNDKWYFSTRPHSHPLPHSHEDRFCSVPIQRCLKPQMYFRSPHTWPHPTELIRYFLRRVTPLSVALIHTIFNRMDRGNNDCSLSLKGRIFLLERTTAGFAF
jgi:hypothetical protein